MSKKAVDAELAAYKTRGMKAPRPEGYSKPSPSEAPSGVGAHAEKHDPHTSDMYTKPSREMASEAPKHTGAAHKPAEAKLPFTGLNAGEKMDAMDYYHNPLSESKSGATPDKSTRDNLSSAKSGKKRPDAKE